MKAIELLADFIERHRDGRAWPNNEWLNGDDMAVYVRRSVPRYLTDDPKKEEKYVTLDIASVTVYEKGQGNFTRFLEEAEKLNPWPAIYVESVLEPRLEKFLLRKGYTEQDRTPKSFFKMKGKENVPENPRLVLIAAS